MSAVAFARWSAGTTITSWLPVWSNPSFHSDVLRAAALRTWVNSKR
jgi:hypothetical protein